MGGARAHERQTRSRRQARPALPRAEEPTRANEDFKRIMAALAVLAHSTGDLDQLLPRICRDAAAAFGVPAATIALLQEPAILIAVAATEPHVPLGVGIPVDAAGFLPGQAVREQSAIYRNRVPLGAASGLPRAWASTLAAPIMAGAAVLGTITLAIDEPDHFGDEDLIKVAQLAYIIAGALSNARTYQRERRIAAQLRELERWRAAFLHVMAHELRTPLGQVMGFIDLLSAESDRLSSRGRRYIEHARQASETLEGVVQRALDVLDLFSADTRLTTEPTSLAALVQLALAANEATLRAKTVSLHVTMPGQPVVARIDSRRVYQAIGILLDNAAKFVPAEGSVAVTLSSSAAWAEVATWNSGPAVPAAIAEQIFSQGLIEDTLTRRHGGVGLSLLLARRIAELHGGSLRLDPSGVGARFVLALPLSPPWQPESEAAQDGAA